MPIVSVVPWENSNKEIVIYLSYTQQGAGHYDAVTASQESSGTDTDQVSQLESRLSTDCKYLYIAYFLYLGEMYKLMALIRDYVIFYFLPPSIIYRY